MARACLGLGVYALGWPQNRRTRPTPRCRCPRGGAGGGAAWATAAGNRPWQAKSGASTNPNRRMDRA
eukprot:357344-Lingulodinium_polyedra.AAC.1